VTARCALPAALGLVALLGGCERSPNEVGDPAAEGSATNAAATAEPSTTGVLPGPSRAPAAASDGQALDLALLPPDARFVDARPAARAGHLFEHGDLPRPEPEPDLVVLTFADLAAPRHEPPSPGSTRSRPPLDEVLSAEVRAANGRRVVFSGFATVERSEGGASTALVLTRLPPACCLGRVPAPDERLHVEVPAGLALVVDPWRPVRVTGLFAAEERRDAYGLFEGLYFLAADGARVE
jgi:hypothetical protein